MRILGEPAQTIIWTHFYFCYGLEGVKQVIVDAGNSVGYADRLKYLMYNYWFRTEAAQQRPGLKYFHEFLYRLVHKPDDGSTPIPGDFSAADSVLFIAGRYCLSVFLAEHPEFQPVIPSPNRHLAIDTLNLFDGFNYMIGFPPGIATFMSIQGDIWTPYLGTSDSETDSACIEFIFGDYPDV